MSREGTDLLSLVESEILRDSTTHSSHSDGPNSELLL